MRPERERAAQPPLREDDLGGEREVDIARYGWAILSRWWLVLAATAVGAVIGWLVAVGGGNTFEASATIYLGQPLTPSSGSQIQTIQTNPTTINQIVRSEAVVQSVASQLDIPRGALRSGITTRAVTGAAAARAGQAQLVEITVRGPWRRPSAEAANMLADIAVERISAYPEAKIEQLEALLASIDEEIEALDQEIEQYRSTLSGDDLPATDRLIVVGLLGGAQRDRSSLVQQRGQTELSLSLARDVERARVLTRATARQVAARSSRSSIVVGAVIGLVVGVGLALAWDPVRRRLGRGAPA